jgi:nicotinate-nucleotide adenylyltransferase
MKEKIAIFGSAFNPPHNGHLKIVSKALDFFKFDRVFIIPTGKPPHKNVEEFSPQVRYFMAGISFFCFHPKKVREYLTDFVRDESQRAFFIDYYERNFFYFHNERLLLSDYEIKRKEKSYTIETVRYFKKEYPESEISIIIGMDEAICLDTWKEWEKLKEMVTFVVAKRAEVDENKVKEKFPFLIFFPFEEVNISSTFIREKIKNEEDITGLVPDVVKLFLSIYLPFKAKD